jgi:TolB-like protein/class 3 adenylate cyclase/tetratricopeptide (TPR) repeat protein
VAPTPFRKLAVILHADVVGSTTLVRRNETVAHQRIQDAFRRFSKTIEVYGGIAHELRGDALVAEFERASDAVAASLAFQTENSQFNSAIDDDIQPHLRIGVAMGEVVIADNTITGNGVVLAQRLEQLADSGGVCIQDAAYQTVPKRFPFEYENLGEQELKGFEEPERVFAVSLTSGVRVPPPERRGVVGRAGWSILAGAGVAVLVVIGGILAWWQPWVLREEPASVERMAFPLPDKPSIAVLPFTNMSGDSEQEYFVDGMTEDLITDLSKLSGLFVIARNSTFTYKGKPVKIRQVAEELGVRYVLEGSVRRAGGQVRINAQLIDAMTGGHLWAERYDGALTDVFALQDKVAERIVEALAVELTPQETQRVGRIGTDSTAAHDVYMLGLSFYYRRTPKDNAQAVAHFRQAIELDPGYSDAYTALAKAYLTSFWDIRYANLLGVTWRDTYAQAFKFLTKVKGQPNADRHVIRSWLALVNRQHELAIEEAQRALELRPNDADALEALAEALIYAGRPKEGMDFAQRAKRQNPTLFARPLYLMGLAEFAMDSPDGTIELVKRARGLSPENTFYAGILAAAYAETGLMDQAKESIIEFSRALGHQFPNVAEALWPYPFLDPNVLRRLAAAFKRAGAPDEGYLPLYADNKLSDTEIQSLLFGAEIEGTSFWRYTRWRQQRTADGVVQHSGFPIQLGSTNRLTHGVGRIDRDLLCERWPEFSEEVELCVSIFRMPNADTRIARRGDYVMVTFQGPMPFRVVE